jgi:hypothetical protein
VTSTSSCQALWLCYIFCFTGFGIFDLWNGTVFIFGVHLISEHRACEMPLCHSVKMHKPVLCWCTQGSGQCGTSTNSKAKCASAKSLRGAADWRIPLPSVEAAKSSLQSEGPRSPSMGNAPGLPSLHKSAWVCVMGFHCGLLLLLLLAVVPTFNIRSPSCLPVHSSVSYTGLYN